MALVATNEVAYALHPKTKQRFVLCFGKQQFLVPESAIVSFPKRSNKVPDGKALGVALATKAPEKWFPFCDPDCLILIRGNEGTSVYTTFEVPGHPDEVRFLRHVGFAIAEKCLKEWQKEVARQVKAVKDGEADPKDATHGRVEPKDYNERQKIRYDVLKWKKERDCPSRAQLHPELNSWTQLSKEGGEILKSCKVDPTSKARPKGPSTAKGGPPVSGEKRKRAAEDDDVVCDPYADIEWVRALRVGPKGSYSIDERDGKVYIIQYKHAGSSAEAGPSTATEEADEEEE